MGKQQDDSNSAKSQSDKPKKKRGGARPGSGRKKKLLHSAPTNPDARGYAGQTKAAEIRDALNKPPALDEPYEIQRFRAIDMAGVRESLELRKWLYDKADGKAIQTVNHVHDKPIEMNVTVSLAEAIQKARKRVQA